jgi:hypothetical protein
MLHFVKKLVAVVGGLVYGDWSGCVREAGHLEELVVVVRVSRARQTLLAQLNRT